ncbi:MAG: hypothetical protein QXG03_06320 [Halalkalicoccus sp.]
MSDRDDLELTETEREALHDCQIAIEYVYRAHGDLLDFHHNLGHAMDRFDDADGLLREAGHEERADELVEEHLPAGAVEDLWSYELVGDFRANMLAEITAFESELREELADGLDHVSERRQQVEWRERAGWEKPD